MKGIVSEEPWLEGEEWEEVQPASGDEQNGEEQQETRSPSPPPNSPANPFLALSAELVSTILEFCYPNAQSVSKQGQRGYADLSRVCQAWRDPAQRNLWKEIRLWAGSRQHKRCFESAAAGRYLTHGVLVYGIDTAERINELQLIKRLRGIRKLELLGMQAIPVDLFSHECFAGLQNLTLSSKITEASDYLTHYPQFQLEHLSITAADESSLRLLEPLLESSQGSITDLKVLFEPRLFSPYPYSTKILIHLKPIATTLTSLTVLDGLVLGIEPFPLPGSKNIFYNFIQCTHLLSHLSIVVEDKYWPASLVLQHAFSCLNRPLTTFKLMNKDTTTAAMLEVITTHLRNSRTLGHLQVLTVEYATRREVLEISGGAGTFLMDQAMRMGTEVRFWEA
ncbi:hypothetical protein T439DRAFT_321396 [Meredithblackwellia eburnea MCA 4105]